MTRTYDGIRQALGVLAAALCLLPALAAAQTARVSGAVTDAATGAPVSGGVVRFCSATAQCATVSTSQTGTYTVLLPAGQYYASTNGFEAQGLVNVWHTGEPCPGACDGLDRPFRLPSLVISLAGRFQNFALPRGGSIEGRVTNAFSGAPVSDVWVRLHGAADASVVAMLSDAAGTVRLRGLVPGAYTAEIVARQAGYEDQVYPGITCLLRCESRSGQPIVVEAGRVSPLDVALMPGGSITGRVVDADTQLPIASATVLAFLDSGDRTLPVISVHTNAEGVYRLTGIPAGRYRLVASTSTLSGQGHIYGGEACGAAGECQPAFLGGRGEVVEVSPGASLTNRNFTLLDRVGFDGVITEAGTGAPVTSGTVSIYRSVNGRAVRLGSVPVTAEGRYQVRGLPPGQYFADFQNGTHAPITLRSRLCTWTRCDTATVEADTPISAGGTQLTAVINLQTPRAGTLSVIVSDDATGLPLDGMVVRIVRGGTTPLFVDFDRTGTTGSAIFNGVAPGSYYVVVGGPGKVSEAYENATCQSQSWCTTSEVVARGRAVMVSAGTNTSALVSLAAASGAPFRPDPPYARSDSGSVSIGPSRPTYGPLATDFVLEAAAVPGPPTVTLSMTENGLTFPSVPPGTYWLRVSARNAAGTSPPSEWTRITVGSGAPEPVWSMLTWLSGNRLTMTWSTNTDGAPATDYIVEAGSAAGLANIARVAVPWQHFTFGPVPPGVYFLRVRARNAHGESAALDEEMIVVGDTPAPPRRPGQLVRTLRGSTLTLSWQAPAGGADGYVLEAGTSEGRADIGSFDVGAVTTFTATNVPPGIYYLRIRARNARGLGLPSSDVRLAVP